MSDTDPNEGGIQPDVTTPRDDEGTAASAPTGGEPAGGGADRDSNPTDLGQDPGAPSTTVGVDAPDGTHTEVETSPAGGEPDAGGDETPDGGDVTDQG